MANTNCIFCNISLFIKIYETKNFYVILDNHPLLPGHIMITSKQHKGCGGELSKNELMELIKLKEKYEKKLLKIYGSVSCYEHGRSGCCIINDLNKDCHHFHLHILPLKQDIIDDLLYLPKKIQMDSYTNIIDLFEDWGEYLFYQNTAGMQFFFPTHNINIKPHLFRTIISKKIGNLSRANWENYVF